jgi:hypothetical protein
VNDITQISIKEYLESIGVSTRQEGKRYFASSPFSRDSNWSFVIYPTNTYFDFSTGHGGNIINLVSRIRNISLSDAALELKQGIKYEKYKPNYKRSKEELFKEVEFDLSKYINKNPEECTQIHKYALTRGIREGYFCGVFFTRNKEKWVRVPALGFLHVDKNLKPCGAKFRRLIPLTGSNDQSPRFSARGQLGWYVLSNETQTGTLSEQPTLYVVESESSANSLINYMKGINRPTIVLSRGGVSSAPKLEDLPEHFQKLPKKLIIDYDGNEELYNQRLKLYKDLDAQPIKLILQKGEDINSLYCKNEMWKIENLLL